MPTISIVIPTYNNLELFKKAFTSVQKQTVKPTEIIISDDSSSDDIMNWVKAQNNPIIKYYRNTPSLGAVRNWNNGIEKASGEWVIVLHHDEELGGVDHIEKLHHHFANSDIIISDIRVRAENGERKGKINGIWKKLLLSISSSLFFLNPIGPCACVAFKKSLGQSFDPNLTWIVDTEWYYRLFKSADNIKYLPDLLIYSNHGHSDQITANIDIAQKVKDDTKYLNDKYSDSFSVKMALRLNTLKIKVKK